VDLRKLFIERIIANVFANEGPSFCSVFEVDLHVDWADELSVRDYMSARAWCWSELGSRWRSRKDQKNGLATFEFEVEEEGMRFRLSRASNPLDGS
jgi:hypothetical protein